MSKPRPRSGSGTHAEGPRSSGETEDADSLREQWLRYFTERVMKRIDHRSHADWLKLFYGEPAPRVTVSSVPLSLEREAERVSDSRRSGGSDSAKPTPALLPPSYPTPSPRSIMDTLRRADALK